MGGIAWDYGLQGPEQFMFEPVAVNTRNVSFADGSDEVWDRYWKWLAVIDWPNLTHDQYHSLAGHLSRGEGRKITYQIPIFNYRKMIGNKAGTVTFAAAVAGAATLGTQRRLRHLRPRRHGPDRRGGQRPARLQVRQHRGRWSDHLRPEQRAAHRLSERWHAQAPQQFDSGAVSLETMELTSGIGSPMFPAGEPNFFQPLTASFESSLKTNP